MRPHNRSSRRTFLMATAAAATAGSAASAGAFGPNDRVRIATVGMGIIGFIDTACALRVPGVELVAVADLYAGRRTHAREVHGDRVDAYVDYRDVLARKDVDAVLLCVPDHWHARMSIDAMKAGKAVYCEKPMVRTVAEGPDVIRAQQETKAVFQVGSQFASSVVFDKLKDLLANGAIGKLHAVEARYNRNSALGRGSTRSRPMPRRRPSTGTASWAMRRGVPSTPTGSSAGGSTGITARRSPATCSSTC